jgi:hypothetical protein
MYKYYLNLAVPFFNVSLLDQVFNKIFECVTASRKILMNVRIVPLYYYGALLGLRGRMHSLLQRVECSDDLRILFIKNVLINQLILFKILTNILYAHCSIVLTLPRDFSKMVTLNPASDNFLEQINPERPAPTTANVFCLDMRWTVMLVSRIRSEMSSHMRRS